MLLQRDDPLIFLLYAEMRAFLKNVLSRFIQVQSIVDAGDDITKVKYKDPSCQMSDDKLYIGMLQESSRENYWMKATLIAMLPSHFQRHSIILSLCN